jgi:zinc protease
MKKNLLQLAGLLLFLSSNIALAQTSLNQSIPVDPKVKIGKLENGLTYYIRQNSLPEKKVELRLVVNVGSVQEDPDQLGLAHFMEHMGFNGSKNFPKNELVNYLQSVGVKFGADLNAYTSFDETVYILPIASDNPGILEKGFTVLEDWAFNNLLDTNEINKERGVVLEESRLSKGSWERLSRQYLPKLFNGSKYAERLPIGKDSILRGFKPAVLERFYKQWYRPSLMAVVVVGDIDPAEAERLIKAHFSSAKDPVNVPVRPSIINIQARTEPEAMVLTDEETTQASLQIYNFVRPKNKVLTWADYRRTLVEQLMTTLINSRLQEISQKENSPFQYAYTGLSSFLRGYESFNSYAVFGDKPISEAVDVLIAETERARKFGFLETELSRAKANLLNQTETQFKERDKSKSGSIVGEYVSNFLSSSPIPGIENRFKFIQEILPGISLAEVNDVVKNMPASNNAFSLVTAPASMKAKLPDSDSLEKMLVAAAKKPVEPFKEKAIPTKLLDKEPKKGSIVKESRNEKLGTINFTLSNGVSVTLKPTNFKNDQILMDAWRWGGAHKFPLEDKANAENAAQIIRTMGVKDMAPADLNKFLTGKTLNVWPYLNDNEEGIEGSSSIKDFETFLQLTYLYFTQPRKDVGLFNAYIDKQKSSIQFIMKNPQAFFSDTITKVRYNNNPWADQIPSVAYYNTIDVDKTMSLYKQIFSNAYGMHFTFTGNLDEKTVKPLLEKYLASLPSAVKENNYKDVGLRPVKGIIEHDIKRGKAEQSMVQIFFSGETTFTPKESMALSALMESLNIEVIEKLREEMGGIYGGGFNGYIFRRPYTGFSVSARIPCGPENVEKLTSALMSLIKGARENGVEQKTLDKVKEGWRKQQQVNLKDNSYWHHALSAAWIERDNPEEILNYEKNVNAITVADLKNAAVKYLSLDNYVKMVLYPEAVAKTN